MEASVRSLIADEVLRIDDAWKLALSSTTRVVFPLIALSPPPITPASAIAPAASAITRFDGSSVYASSFSARNASPAFAAPDEDGVAVQQVASNACMGCASSAMMKFVISTMLLIGFRPIAVSRALQPERRRLHGNVLENQRAVSRAKIEILDLVSSIAAGPCGQ